MSRMSSMDEAYAKLNQDQIDEIEEKFAKADAAQKILKNGVKRILIELLGLLHGK